MTTPTSFNAGNMDREIVLQTATVAQDPVSGEEVIDWDNQDVTLWAQWLPGGTREAWHAQQRLGAYIEGVFRIYDRDPRPTPEGSRIVFEGRTYDVKPLMEIGRGEGLEIPVVAHGERP